VTDGRRHDEEAYEQVRTLEVLAGLDKGVPAQLYSFLRLLTRIRKEAPELWEQILDFVRRTT
jgi:hypothetical protein